MPLDCSTTRGIAAWREQLQAERRRQTHLKHSTPPAFKPVDALHSARFRRNQTPPIGTCDASFPFDDEWRRRNQPFMPPPSRAALSPAFHTYKPTLQDAAPTAFTGRYDGYSATWGPSREDEAPTWCPSPPRPRAARRPQTSSAAQTSQPSGATLTSSQSMAILRARLLVADKGIGELEAELDEMKRRVLPSRRQQLPDMSVFGTSPARKRLWRATPF